VLTTKKLKPLLPQEDYLPHVAYDCVIFGFDGKELKILILEYHNTGYFALPGGFIKVSESIDTAVKHGLKERTGLDNIYLEQFYTFGSMSRVAPDTMRTILKANDFDCVESNWLFDRFISVAYYALINYNSVTLKPDEFSDSINWYSIDELPDLMMDHNEISKKALQVLRANLEKNLIGMNLLPDKFTMKELKEVYEVILGEKLGRTSFQRKILSLDILIRHEKLYTGGAHKAPYVYSFKTKNN
tara:strand:+ start:16783 stop:17514 length:732 start_codon:yes stop_codon:yes gene_type:complete